jgi:hypothetical protein
VGDVVEIRNGAVKMMKAREIDFADFSDHPIATHGEDEGGF